ncbi:hypothetical protein PINS_up024311 [Pythium insidiosum]|nr:hypothetical protein PINS_up024311 [Pythium insidiosum]
MHEEDEFDDTQDAAYAEAPSFSLLAPNALFPSTVESSPPHEAVDAPPTFNLLGDATSFAPPPAPAPIDLAASEPEDDDAVEYVPPAPTTDAKLAQAGLDLSDSDDDSTMKRRLLRRKSRSDSDDQQVPTTTDSTPAQSTWECLVCTHFNSPSHSHCELCATSREGVYVSNRSPNNVSTAANDHDYIDLASSPPQEEDEDASVGMNTTRQYIDFDDDFENPYASFPDPVLEDDYRSRRSTNIQDVEDISDHEAPQPYDSQQRRYSRRPALRAFEHFVCVEDLDNDPSCKINYRTMFADSGRGKSYSDRFAKRRRESQKRKAI